MKHEKMVRNWKETFLKNKLFYNPLCFAQNILLKSDFQNT